MGSFSKEFFQLIMRAKKWWLVPMLAIVVLAGVLLFVSTRSGISSALYPST